MSKRLDVREMFCAVSVSKIQETNPMDAGLKNDFVDVTSRLTGLVEFEDSSNTK